MRAQTSADGRLREQYTYHGAHTSLWNGRGVQVANLPRPMDARFEKPEEVERALAVIACRSIELVEYEYPGLDALEVLASCLRSMIVAAPGHRFISADFTAIQAVVTAALAGEEWRLDVFREDADVYLAQASRMTGTPMAEYAAHKQRTGKHHEHRQNPGKLAVLSGDFGAWINGWKRFGADKVLGSDDNIKAAILRTRATIPAICELWGGQTRDRFDRWNERPELYGLEGAVVAALQNPGQAYEDRGVAYQMHGADLLCQTPDGGVMYYHNAALRPSERPYARPWEFEVSYEGWNSNAGKGPAGWQTMSLYGGVLTQNAVSRTARQPQALALLRLEAAGYPVVMHTHDEGVLEVPIGTGSAAEATALWRILPPWAVTPDGRLWPIKVPDAWEGPRYGKF
jgi:DNA polymerase